MQKSKFFQHMGWAKFFTCVLGWWIHGDAENYKFVRLGKFWGFFPPISNPVFCLWFLKLSQERRSRRMYKKNLINRKIIKVR